MTLFRAPAPAGVLAFLLATGLGAAGLAWAQEDPPERPDRPYPGDEVRPPEGGEPGRPEGRDPRESVDRERERRGPGQPGQPGRPEAGPDGRMPRPPQGFGPGMMPLGPEELAKVEAFLKEFDPGRLEKLRAVRRDNPDVYMRIMQESAMEMRKLEQLRQENPERYQQVVEQRKLEAETQELAAKLRKTPPEEEKASLMSRLEAAVSKLFDMREAERENEVRELERQVAKLKERIARRKESRLKIIEARLAELMGERDDLDW